MLKSLSNQNEDLARLFRRKLATVPIRIKKSVALADLECSRLQHGYVANKILAETFSHIASFLSTKHLNIIYFWSAMQLGPFLG